jgi:hypothetical protein
MALHQFENTSFSETWHLRKLLQGINLSEQKGFGIGVFRESLNHLLMRRCNNREACIGKNSHLKILPLLKLCICNDAARGTHFQGLLLNFCIFSVS